MISNIYLLFNTLHIIGFVCWFGGLFYVVRIFVYFTESDQSDVDKTKWEYQYSLMEQRCYYIITLPGLFITWTFGLGMLVVKYIYDPIFLASPWLWIKLFLLILLTIYNFYCGKIVRCHKQGKPILNSFQFRLLNEVPTIFLILICVLGIYKSMTNFWYLTGSILIILFLLHYIAKKYKEYRLKKLNKK
ncbi:MAG: CopD family protein [Chitinophagaceae bacterium]